MNIHNQGGWVSGPIPGTIINYHDPFNNYNIGNQMTAQQGPQQPKMDETHYTTNRGGLYKTLDEAVKACRGMITYGDVTIHECKPIKTVSLSFKVEDLKMKK